MNDRSRPLAIELSIAAVERDTGLSKDTLRVWERRYGFPRPRRDALGERIYSLEEVDKLRVLKRLLDGGHRPGRVVPLELEALLALAAQTVDQPLRAAAEAAVSGASATAVDLRAYLELLRAHEIAALRSQLTHASLRLGVARFVLEVVGPLNTAIGDAWIRGELEIFEEHAATEVLQGVLRRAIASIPEPAGEPAARVLLSTFPGEPHGLGLLMAEAMFALEGCRCVSLGPQTPLWDVVLAAQAFESDIVGLSFTGCMNPNTVVEGLVELRAKLPARVAVWAGGTAPVLHRRRVEGVQPLGSLELVAPQLQAWRQTSGRVGGN